mmetsp:Transcript_534/g.896  ORF Transcript_534/g.896 Transcript_534/m.896 type:complete len:224 (-) Transcript_534:43-714(-)
MVNNDLDQIVEGWINESGITNDSNRKGLIPLPTERIESTIKSGLGFKKTNNNEVGKSSNVKQGKEQLFGNTTKKNNSSKNSSVTREQNPESHLNHGFFDNFDNEESRTSIGAKKSIIKNSVQIESTPEESKVSEKKISERTEIGKEDINPTKKSKADSDVNEVKKKRIKTRSKQKNIRRDRRADHVKPEHLQIGNVAYAGRPLTDATKAALNLPLKTNKQSLT